MYSVKLIKYGTLQFGKSTFYFFKAILLFSYIWISLLRSVGKQCALRTNFMIRSRDPLNGFRRTWRSFDKFYVSAITEVTI